MAIHAYVYICIHFYVFCKVSQHPSASVLRDVDGVEEVKDRGRVYKEACFCRISRAVSCESCN